MGGGVEGGGGESATAFAAMGVNDVVVTVGVKVVNVGITTVGVSIVTTDDSVWKRVSDIVGADDADDADNAANAADDAEVAFALDGGCPGGDGGGGARNSVVRDGNQNTARDALYG